MSASCGELVTRRVGDYELRATYAGSDCFASSKAPRTLVVSREVSPVHAVAGLLGSSFRRLDFVSHVFDVSLGLVFRIDLFVILKNPRLLCFVLSIQLTAFQFRFQ